MVEPKNNDSSGFFVLVDKPQGMTSHDVVSKCRRIFNTKKVGHCGTLDPMATGLLPIAIGSATKTVRFFLGGEKEYSGEITLGISTDTLDKEGVIVAEKKIDFLDDFENKIHSVVPKITGTIEQKVPMYSAVKINGKKLYQYAREGISIERPKREVKVFSFNILESNPKNGSFKFRTRVSKGTYIRVLAEDIGTLLGCGGHLSALRREGVEHLSIGQSTPLSEIKKETVQKMSITQMLKNIPRVTLTYSEAQTLFYGQSLTVEKNNQILNNIIYPNIYPNESENLNHNIIQGIYNNETFALLEKIKSELKTVKVLGRF